MCLNKFSQILNVLLLLLNLVEEAKLINRSTHKPQILQEGIQGFMKRGALGYNLYVSAADVFHHFACIISATIVLPTWILCMYIESHQWYVWQQNILCRVVMTVLIMVVHILGVHTLTHMFKHLLQLLWYMLRK